MRKVLLLVIGMFSLGFDAYVVAGLLPYIGATFHTSDSQTGQAVSVFTLCYALAAPIFATLLAGKPVRRILLLALAVFSAANGASALASNFSLLLIARAVAGIGAGLFSPLAASAAAALVSNEKQGRALGLTLGGMSMGTVIGVPIGLLIAEQVGWQGTLWVVTVIGLIAMIGIVAWFPNFPAVAPPSLGQRFAMMTDGRVSATVGITLITSVASLGLYTYIASILHSLAGITSITPYLWVWGIGGVIGSFSIGTLIDRTKRPGWLMVGILIILAIAMFSLPFGLAVPIVAFLPIFIWGAMGWASQAPQQHVLLLYQPKHGAASVALNSSANYLGSAIGSTLGGVAMVAGLAPSKFPFAAGCLIFVALLGQLSVMSWRRKENSGEK
ncbi:MFS transporter [Cohnella lubricantis]|uniref:MFS transporter n=1 Tax=Cohnella lubricantis TaxID=2163172 RepID=A0A841TD30_9BACL|nr:MFS transporter [Cohnella lubricantis]MBB6676361.1 MFS transporter [Cohnella lubricantis]MBP2118782.1 putative MFS family arabinose efflux permease [Cohnella lubricantis]